MKSELQKEEGVVVSIKANYYLVDIAIKKEKRIRLLCTCRSKLKFSGSFVSVGDSVIVQLIDLKNYTGVICFINPRSSFLLRPQVANVTDLFVVVSLEEPKFDPQQTSRFLITAEHTGQNVHLVLTKKDLINSSQSNSYMDRLKAWGYNPILTSVKSDSGMFLLLEKIQNIKLGVFCGPSGAGKSSLLNYLIPEASIPIGQLSKKLKRGKHTTRNVQLFSIGKGSLLADTPGFNKPNFLFERHNLPFLFPEFKKQFNQGIRCKFRNCMHINEPGCEVDKQWERYSYYCDYVNETS